MPKISLGTIFSFTEVALIVYLFTKWVPYCYGDTTSKTDNTKLWWNPSSSSSSSTTFLMWP